MKKVELFKIAASSLILGATVTACNAGGNPRVASASDKAPSVKGAANAAQSARKFLAKQNFAKAIAQAELAVAAVPDNAGYRALLGQAYLGAGRFQSAEAALADAFTLDPSDGKTALSLALAQIALAKNSAALETLEKAKGQMAAADYGLALALAGNTGEAVAALERAVRGLESDAKARQNLALAYALANRWANARIMAAQDLAPDMVDARLSEWAAFARPQASWDQVASLLGVKPVWDPGQPSRLALNAAPAAAPVAVAAVEAAPEPEPEMAQMGDIAADPAPVFETASAEAPKPAFQQIAAVVVPETRPEAAPAPEPEIIRSEPKPIKQAVVPASRPAKFVVEGEESKPSKMAGVESGKFVVQLGAFSSEARAQAAWKGANGKVRELSNFNMATPRVQVNKASLYRLSVSGFTTMAAAEQVCRKVQASGGQCFVRSVTGGAPIQWASRKSGGGTRIAARK